MLRTKAFVSPDDALSHSPRRRYTTEEVALRFHQDLEHLGFTLTLAEVTTMMHTEVFHPAALLVRTWLQNLRSRNIQIIPLT
jgi:hypothetical protein